MIGARRPTNNPNRRIHPSSHGLGLNSFVPRSGTRHLRPTVWDRTTHASSHGLGRDHPPTTAPPYQPGTRPTHHTSLASDELIAYVLYHGSEWRGTDFFSSVPLLTTTQHPRLSQRNTLIVNQTMHNESYTPCNFTESEWRGTDFFY